MVWQSPDDQQRGSTQFQIFADCPPPQCLHKFHPICAADGNIYVNPCIMDHVANCMDKSLQGMRCEKSSGPSFQLCAGTKISKGRQTIQDWTNGDRGYWATGGATGEAVLVSLNADEDERTASSAFEWKQPDLFIPVMDWFLQMFLLQLAWAYILLSNPNGLPSTSAQSSTSYSNGVSDGGTYDDGKATDDTTESRAHSSDGGTYDDGKATDDTTESGAHSSDGGTYDDGKATEDTTEAGGSTVGSTMDEGNSSAEPTISQAHSSDGGTYDDGKATDDTTESGGHSSDGGTYDDGKATDDTTESGGSTDGSTMDESNSSAEPTISQAHSSDGGTYDDGKATDDTTESGDKHMVKSETEQSNIHQNMVPGHPPVGQLTVAHQPVVKRQSV
ncbi:unnamed protein product [Notodromas monacha]|uniref:Kazal-like domain-containing protein n=1 Tax=Notodromas monacha TaxID=399045 RepID=A0A7R9BVY6_9CRUS|nr:unnamed protein product [Notodromas monacha]CAG0922738.1 unnamed protein product [Notodromas monacha]